MMAKITDHLWSFDELFAVVLNPPTQFRTPITAYVSRLAGFFIWNGERLAGVQGRQ